ncbi:hypothetical protein MOPEL_067_00500 [Mobilicoccus pelagius NBRC 104925]|uniref:Uncharacterized protein n=1 Tax=Mobilicoccus pelagius NBRC 104925 TaxID=1089455 RepID=H5UR43_9MICO|nr:hypothetical protein MOPEL_067_00500 [Mobilicoccus pelagius NBRC 104925]
MEGVPAEVEDADEARGVDVGGDPVGGERREERQSREHVRYPHPHGADAVEHEAEQKTPMRAAPATAWKGWPRPNASTA